MESEGEWAKCSYKNVQVWFGGVLSRETKSYPRGGKFDSLHVALLLAEKEQTRFPLWNRSWMLFPKTQQIIFFSRSRPPTSIPSSPTKQTCRWSSTTSSLSLYTCSTSSRLLPRITLISRMCGLNQDQKAPYATNRKKITLIIIIVVNITWSRRCMIHCYLYSVTGARVLVKWMTIRLCSLPLRRAPWSLILFSSAQFFLHEWKKCRSKYTKAEFELPESAAVDDIADGPMVAFNRSRNLLPCWYRRKKAKLSEVRWQCEIINGVCKFWI